MKKSIRSLTLVAGALGLAAALAGCQAASSNTPANATAPSVYQQGAQAMNDFASDLVSAQNIEMNLHKGGTIPDATHVKIQAVFKGIAGYGTQIDALILAQASATTITARINSAIASLTSIATTAASLDANTSAQVNGSVQALQMLLTNLLPIFANVSAAQTNPHTLEVAFGSADNRNTGRAGSIFGLADLQPGQGRAARQDRSNDADANRNSYLRRRREVRAG